MRLPVTINGCRLVALLDSGSTHNFIGTELLHHLHLATSAHPTIQVLVANGDRAPCHGVTPSIALTIGTEDFDLRFFGIDLGGFEVILGVEFLRTLGPILWDFDDLCMTFDRGDWRLVWRGLDSTRQNTAEPIARVVVTIGK